MSIASEQLRGRQNDTVDDTTGSSAARGKTSALGSFLAALLLSGLWLTGLDFALARLGAPADRIGALGGHVSLLLVLGLGLFVIAKLADLIAGHRAFRDRDLLQKLIVGSAFALVAVVPSWIVATELTSGDWISQQSFTAPLRYGLLATLAVGSGCLAVHVVGAVGVRLWPSLWLLAAAGAARTNHLVLPGLYPAFHVTLHAFAAALSLLAIQRWVRAFRHWRLPLVVALAGSLGAVMAGTWSMVPERRAAAFRNSPGLGDLLASFFPRPDAKLLRQALELEDVAEPKPAPRTSLGVPRPKNVLVLVADALRADAIFRTSAQPPHYREEGDTPFLDEWLASAYRFPNAYAPASRTNLSMPASFLSREPFEDTRRLGVPLAMRARRLGLTPLAVVPEWFTTPFAAGAEALLEGFEGVETYSIRRQEDFSKLVERTLDATDSQPFFLWVHYFGMHDPYFIGTKKHARGATQAQRYRAALRYMDRQFHSLVRELRKRKLLDDTLVVLMSDHGELLGEHGLEHHGMSVHVEEIHVPLAIWVPGGGSGEVRALAGNIDVIPTIFELLEDPHPPRVRGRSLVPDMSSLAAESDRALYALSGNAKQSSLITQKHRLVLTHASGTFSLYARTDAAETNNLLGRDPAVDRSLISELVRRNPRRFKSGLDDPETRETLRRRLKQPFDPIPLARLEFLFELAALAEDTAAIEQIKHAYDRSTRLDRQMLVLSQWFPREPEHWTPRIMTLLEKYAGRPEETELVDELARAGVHGLKTSFVVGRLLAVAETCDLPLATAWLSLIANWENPPPYVAPLTRFFDCAATQDATGEHGLLARVLAGIESLTTNSVLDLEARIFPLLEHPSEWVALSALRALGAVGGAASKEKLEALLRDSAARSRWSDAALLALARLEGPGMLPQLLALDEDPKQMLAVLRTLTAVGDERALPFLENVEKTHENPWLQYYARRALEAIRTRSAKKGPIERATLR